MHADDPFFSLSSGTDFYTKNGEGRDRRAAKPNGQAGSIQHSHDFL